MSVIRALVVLVHDLCTLTSRVRSIGAKERDRRGPEDLTYERFCDPTGRTIGLPRGRRARAHHCTRNYQPVSLDMDGYQGGVVGERQENGRVPARVSQRCRPLPEPIMLPQPSLLRRPHFSRVPHVV